jgi:hypothetical protein
VHECVTVSFGDEPTALCILVVTILDGKIRAVFLTYNTAILIVQLYGCVSLHSDRRRCVNSATVKRHHAVERIVINVKEHHGNRKNIHIPPNYNEIRWDFYY